MELRKRMQEDMQTTAGLKWTGARTGMTETRAETCDGDAAGGTERRGRRRRRGGRDGAVADGGDAAGGTETLVAPMTDGASPGAVSGSVCAVRLIRRGRS